MEEMNWTQTIANFMLISGAVLVIIKFIDGAYKYADKKKNQALQDSVDAIQKDK